MSKRINNVSIEEIKSNTKRIKAEDEQQPRQQNDDVDNQLSVYNSNNNNDDGDDDEEEVYHPEEDQRLCVFKTPSVTRAVTWVDELRYNLQAKNLTVLRCDVAFNKLFECLSFLRESLPLDNYLDSFLPQVAADIGILKPKAPAVVYLVGMLVKGGVEPFYVFDMAKVRRCMSNFGEFLSIRWSKQYIHNDAYANVIIKYKGFDCDKMKLQNSACVNLPSDDAVGRKTTFVRKFFDIKHHNNEKNYMTGRLIKSVKCEPFTVKRFNELFQFEQDSKSSDEVDMLVGIQIDGFKQGKNDIEFDTLVNNKKVSEKSYSLAIKPMVFFHIEE
ncbi:DNA binding protein dbp1 [Spodoptera exigua multiple nucleopolyhedrovirus]|nr:DNA binding protein dbp1 [Spodoptera exigua multiple nucleopolyhedrovirus]CDG72741.1 DNA binding protein dbp1 [Spodoptera exigua multiple nucleopolyhedrovirus]CDG73030.1 DNA binding protein dbp1 [Spodoptera exigua multiple nucleopolyhedrovirus]